MDYVLKLQELSTLRYVQLSSGYLRHLPDRLHSEKLAAAKAEPMFVNTSALTTIIERDEARKRVQSRNMRIRHLQEKVNNTTKAIHNIEATLHAKGTWESRWREGDVQWRDAVAKLERREYRHALDLLERLVVSRLMEMMKANMSETGTQLNLLLILI
jgi:phenylalanyl-tRNA synthetase alpha subunit